ncbi:MAG: sulfatase [Planctomycetes bacterium]|nr:sulfatase [Planctomycetota bacterium]
MMSRRTFLRGAAAGAAGAGILAESADPAAAAAAEEPPARPNILWITCEDMSPFLGCYGDAYAVTPNIDRLAREGVRYTAAFATAPVCSPARSCLITGMYATSLGTQHLRSQFPIPGYIRGFPSYLRAAGYYCTNNVKTDYNTSREPAIVKDSWDDCSATAHWRGRRPGQPFFAVFNSMQTHQSQIGCLPYETFLKNVQAKLAPAERHDPAGAPLPPYYPDTPITRRAWARMYDCITLMDREHVGRLLKELEDDGLAEDTIVFFYSDGGAGQPRHKRLIHDSGLRVAMLVRFPGKHRRLAPAAPGETVDRLVSFLDFAPTVLSLVGLPVPDCMQGRAFLGPAAGEPNGYVYGARDRVDEAYDCARSVRDARYLYIRNYMPHLSHNQPEWYSDQAEVRREITRLAAEGKLAADQLAYAGPARPLEELYDTQADPHQVRNLAASPEHAQVLQRMRSEHRRWVLETRDTGFLAEQEMVERSAGATPLEMAQRDEKYPLARILAAADLVGRPEALSRQVELLKDGDSAVRYWAAVGLKALGRDAAPAREALRAALADPSATVSVEAAGALAAQGGVQPALDVLVKELRGPRPDAAAHAARTLELLGEAARPVLPAMKEAAAALEENLKKFTGHYQTAFALDSSIRRLEGR